MPHHRLLRRATGEFFHVFSSRRLDFTPIGAMLIDVERERPTRQLANHRRASNVEDHIFIHAGQSQSTRPVAAFVGVQPRHPRRQQQEEVQSATEQSRDAGYAERRVSKDRECVAGSDGATSRQTPHFLFYFWSVSQGIQCLAFMRRSAGKTFGFFILHFINSALYYGCFNREFANYDAAVRAIFGK